MTARKFTAFLLAACIIAGLIPAAFAAEGEEAPQTAETTVPVTVEVETTPTELPTEAETMAPSETELPAQATEPETTEAPAAEPVQTEPEAPETEAAEPKETIAFEEEKTADTMLATVESVRLNTYDQFLAWYHLTYTALDLYLDSDELPYNTYVANAPEKYENALNDWRVATMGAGNLATYTDKEVEFYELLIYDILYQKIAKDSGLENAKTAVSALQSSVMKEIAEAGMEWTLSTKVTSENADALLERMVKLDSLAFAADKINTLKKCAEYMSDVEDLILRFYMLSEMCDATEEVQTILNALYARSTDALMKEACYNMATIASGTMTEADILAIFAGDVALQQVKEYALDKVWDTVISSNALGIGMGLGQTIGKLVTNALCSTDAIVENWYSMQKVHIFEKVLKERVIAYRSQYQGNPTVSNAKLFNKAVDMYLNTLSVGMEYAVHYYEATKGGAFGWLYKHFNSDEYNAVHTSMSRIKTNIDVSIHFSNNNILNFYMDELEAEDAVEGSWTPTTSKVTEEELEAEVAAIPAELFKLTNQVSSTDTTFTEDKTTYANYTHTGGTLDLNGCTLTVYGDFTLTGGTLDLNGGTLDVRGNVYQSDGMLKVNGGTMKVGEDYRIQTRSESDDGTITYSASTGAVLMTSDADHVIIGGDFVIQSRRTTHFDTVDRYSWYSAGTMEVAGDFTQIAAGSSTVYNFDTSGTHKVILNGTEPQYVSFAQNTSGFANLEIAEGAEATFAGYLRVTTLLSDASVTSDGLILYDFGLNGHSLEIAGDVQSTGTVDLAGGTLTIDGDLLHTDGPITLNQGTLKVTGDYKIQSTSGGESTGSLWMQYDEDHVIVGGDFVIQSRRTTHFDTVDRYSWYSAGTIEVAGDFTQIAAGSSTVYNFDTSGTHKVILNGTEPQYVSFAQNTSGFANLEIAEGAEVTFTNYLRVTSLQSDAYVKSDGLILYNFGLNGHSLEIAGDVQSTGTVDLAGGTLTIDGNLMHTSGPITLNQGALKVTEDYKIQSTSGGESTGALRMRYDEDHVIVGGDFLTRSSRHVGSGGTSYSLYSAGTMEVAGDFTQIAAGTSTVYNFNTSGTHKVILNGTEPQYVSFAQNTSGFANLEIAEGAEVTFTNYLRVTSLQSDAYVKSDGLILYNFGLNGHSLEIAGDVQSTGTVDLAGGTLTIDGDLLHTDGPITLNQGTLKVTGDYKIQSTSGGESYGALRMQYDEDHVIVGGDFLTRSNRHVSNSSSNYSLYSAGTMEVAGDFTQIAAGTSTVYNFNTSGTHKVILNGTEPQHVSFAQSTSGFANLEIAEGTDITFANYLRVTDLLTDASVKSDGLILRLTNLNGHTLEIAGDTSVTAAMVMDGGNLRIVGNATISGALTLGGGSLEVTGDAVTSGSINLGGGSVDVGGNLTQLDGVLTLNQGTLSVTGDYKIQSASGSDSAGCLQMQYDEDRVIVGGDFATQSTGDMGSGSNIFSAGTMEVGGNFTQIPRSTSTYYSKNFVASGTHKVILNGTEPQRVSLGHISATIANLEIAEGADVTFANYLHVTNLLSDAAVKSDGLILYNFNLSGRTLHITGDTQMDSGFNTAGGSLTVQGDLIPIGGTVNLNGSTVTVLGNFYHRGGTLSVNKGTLKVLGDMGIHSASGGTSSGVVRMVNDEDLILVFGDYICRSSETGGTASTQNAYSAGTLAVWGNVSRPAGHVYNMNLSGTKLFLMGTGPQSVTFSGATYNKLGTLLLRGVQADYTISGISCGTVQENVAVPAEYFEGIPMLITQQPEGMEVGNQKTATVTVEAIGEGLSYAWFYRNPGAEGWSRSSSVTNVFTTTMDPSKNGREVYCVITDGNGVSLQTDTVVLTMITDSSIVITQQPVSMVVAKGETATVTVEATGDGLTYAWYYRNPGVTSWSRSNSTTNSFSSSMDASKDGREIYCIITDENGFTAQTDTVTVSIVAESSIVITKQPEDTAAPAGQTATVTVEATGDGLTYAWYYKNPSAAGWSRSNSTSNSFSSSMDANKDGRQVYCVITDANGFTETTNTVTLTLGSTGESSIVITQQPEDVAVPIGQTATVEVIAEGDGLTYTWYYRNPSASSWSRSNSTTNSFTTAMDANKNGRQAYCIITDANGFTEQTNTVTISVGSTGESSIVITQQPEDVAVPIGQTATVKVIAEGDGLTYTWYYKNPSASGWSRSNSTTNSFTTAMDANKDGRQAYCVITDANGFTETTETVTISVGTMGESSIVITQQPENVTVAYGESAVVTVEATGDGLTYTWYYRNPGASSWSRSNSTTNSFTTTMDANKDGREAYCIITDANGYTETTQTVILSME